MPFSVQIIMLFRMADSRAIYFMSAENMLKRVRLNGTFSNKLGIGILPF